MSEENPQPNPVLDWVKDHQVPSIFIGLGVVLILGLLLSAVFGEDSDVVTVEITLPPDSASTSTAAETADSDQPEVPQVDCRILLTDDEIDEALFGPDPSGPRSHFTFAQGETCVYEPDDESGHFIKIEPGHPSDFDPDPRPLAVEGVGDAALWFDNGTDMGALSVGVNVPDASLIYRIHIGRSDMNGEERLAQATELALLALPRFPGTPPGPPEPLVDLCEMIPDPQVDEVLAEHRDAHPATRDELFVLENFSDPVDLSEEDDANCRKLILAEIYIETQQGSASDFADGARMEGVPAEPVQDLGEEAVWFADVPYQGGFTAPHERGVLAVRVGDAMFRIIIAVPETPSDDQLEIARRFAPGAIALIPGVEAFDLEPTVVSFDEEPPDHPPFDLEDVLLDGVAEGRWTLGEGLVVLLDWMVNGTPGVVEVDLPEISGTAIIASAWAYLATEPDEADQIRALLDQLILTTAELDAMLEPAEPTSSAATLLVSAAPVAQEDPQDACSVWGLENPCLKKIPLPDDIDLEPGKYSLYVALDEKSQWSDVEVEVAKQALLDSAVTYEPLGEMPPTSLVLRPGGETLITTIAPVEPCGVFIPESQAGRNPDELKQILARDIAFCLITYDLRPQYFEDPNSLNWIVYGLANYLSGVVYPSNNLEHKNLPAGLAQEELTTTVPQRQWTNWILFEHFTAFLGRQGVVDIIRGLPESGDLVSALAGSPSVAEMFHDLGRALSDANVSDLGPGLVPYDPPAWDLVVSAPLEVPVTVPQFGVRRIHMTVPSGKYACADSFSQGQVRMSWRPGAPGEPGSWFDELPESFEGEAVIVLSSVEPGSHYTLDVHDVSDEPDCEEDEETGDALGPILDLCRAICDPSSYYWAPREF